MADWLETLRKLQTVDAELFQLHNEQRQQPLVLEQARQAMAEEDAKAKAIEAHLKASQLQHKEKEIELSTREANVRKLQAQLFQVKTNREYSAIQHEIDQSKADASLLEEEILRILETIDQTKREYEAQLRRAVQQQETFKREEVRVAQALTVIEGQIASLEGQRQTLTPSVEANMLLVYERILASREGIAMVPLIKESCGGCHMVQPPQIVNEAYLKAKLVTCDSCNRILYVDESR